MQKTIISPPFGQFFARKDVSPVFGSYTLKPRAGRYTQAIKTIRPLGKGNWVNKIGLRNPGVQHIPNPPHSQCILSIAAIDTDDWKKIAEILKSHPNFPKYEALELNLSCPNTQISPITSEYLQILKSLGKPLIAKLSPSTKSISLISWLRDEGIEFFHLFNTFPTRKGGLSGQLLRKINLKLLKHVKQKYKDNIKIIAGGGVHCGNDAKEYTKIGVEAVAIGTIIYTPWRIPNTIKVINESF